MTITLLIGAMVFAIIAWLVEEPTIKKISVVCFAVCALVFLVLVILQATGMPLTLR